MMLSGSTLSTVVFHTFPFGVLYLGFGGAGAGTLIARLRGALQLALLVF